MIDSLGALLRAEMKKRSMSLRDFARFTGVSHPTISKIVSDPNYAQLVRAQTLRKLSQALNIDVKTLERTAKQKLLADDDANVRLLIEMIKSLPPQQREMIDTLLRGFAQQNADKRN